MDRLFHLCFVRDRKKFFRSCTLLVFYLRYSYGLGKYCFHISLSNFFCWHEFFVFPECRVDHFLWKNDFGPFACNYLFLERLRILIHLRFVHRHNQVCKSLDLQKWKNLHIRPKSEAEELDFWKCSIGNAYCCYCTGSSLKYHLVSSGFSLVLIFHSEYISRLSFRFGRSGCHCAEACERRRPKTWNLRSTFCLSGMAISFWDF